MTVWALALCLLAGLCPIVLAEETNAPEATVALAAANNTSFDTAIPIQPNTPVTLEGAESGKSYYYELTLKQWGMFAKVVYEGMDHTSWTLLDKDSGEYVGSLWEYDQMLTMRGTVILCINTYDNTPDSITFTVSLLENDRCEPNNSQETAAPLTYGVSTDFVLHDGDTDWFSVTTEKGGQDVAVTISGFNYEMQGSISVQVEPEGHYATLKNDTAYFHVAEAGTHYLCLSRNSGGYCALSVKAELLDGDAKEQNDTKETATLLNGQDLTFSMGGIGDEDWFAFEAAPRDDGTPQQYTLQFLDLNTDYSDVFQYELYAPDGTVIQESTTVNIRHSNIIACDQQGLYYVRVRCIGEKTPRSPLRIRVQEGGGDPYEINDTWLTAAPIQTEQPIQFILANDLDQDWFRFDVPEEDMTLELTFDQATSNYLYSGESLLEGESGRLYGNTGTTGYYKFTEPGAYYLQVSAAGSNVSTDLRTMICTLTAPEDPENNDTWKAAAPVYEGVPQRFDLTAGNDRDWFRMEVPEGTKQIQFMVNSVGHITVKVYRESDFLNFGDSVSPVALVQTENFFSVPVSSADTYYVCFSSDDRCMNNSFSFAYTDEPQHETMETALDLEPGIWSRPIASKGYLCVGKRKAGDLLRIQQTYNGTSQRVYYLMNSAGEYVRGVGEYGPYTWLIPADDIYYLSYDRSYEWRGEGRPAESRFRYDVGSGTEQVNSIEGPDTLTMIVGETIAPDLRLSPYTAISKEGYTYYFSVSNSSVIGYDYEYTGQITAKAAGTAVLTVNANDGNGTTLTKAIEITVTEPVAANSITIQDAPATLPLGQRATLTAVCDTKIASRSVTWSSSDPKVLYVFPDGAVTAVGQGTATITASNGAAASVSITVTKAETPNAVDNVRLDRYSMTLYMDEEPGRLTATVLPEGSQATV